MSTSSVWQLTHCRSCDGSGEKAKLNENTISIAVCDTCGGNGRQSPSSTRGAYNVPAMSPTPIPVY